MELNTCPNCGGHPKLHKKRSQYYYECDGDCWTQTHRYYSEEEARAEWKSLKKRVPDTSLGDQGQLTS